MPYRSYNLPIAICASPLMARACAWCCIAVLLYFGGCLWHSRPGAVDIYDPWTK